MRKIRFPLLLLLAFSLLLSSCAAEWQRAPSPEAPPAEALTSLLSDLPDYSGTPFTPVNGNEPFFTEKEITTQAFEAYSPLDSMGRCGTATACIGTEIMPTEKRGEIGQIKPSGWQTVKYDVVDGKYLYNRCHLIGFQLTGENANEKNLVTGTRYFNVQGMLPFENMVADYVKESGFHVMYRVTPVFSQNELLCRGVLMEGLSVEDDGEGIRFCVWCYNVQPGVELDYTDGSSQLAELEENGEKNAYVLNTNSKKIHLPHCKNANAISEKNRSEVTESLSKLQLQGYSPAGCCM